MRRSAKSRWRTIFIWPVFASRASADLATAISNVNVSDLVGNAADGLFIDDGSSSYPRAGYRISSFRHGAASLLTTEITQSRAHKKISRVPYIAPDAALPIRWKSQVLR
jgi:hypothetical protein